jgi:hypothetical protein
MGQNHRELLGGLHEGNLIRARGLVDLLAVFLIYWSDVVAKRQGYFEILKNII